MVDRLYQPYMKKFAITDLIHVSAFFIDDFPY